MFVFIVTILSVIFRVSFAPAVVRAAEPAVVINELAWMGSSSSTADEWLELRNLTAEPVDIAGWRLTKLSSGAEVTMLTIPAGKILPASGYFLIANYAITNTSSSLNIAPDLVDTDVALNNSALQIKLYDSAGVIRDTADDGIGNPFSGRYISAEKIFYSMERNPSSADGTSAEAWHTASRGVGFKDGKPELGTPGSVNSNGLPLAQAGPDQSGRVGEEINFDGSDSLDPEGQALTMTWDFGDGTASSDPTPRHAYAAAGEYSVTLTVSDGIDTAQDKAMITILSAPAASPTTVISPTQPTTDRPTAPLTSCRGLMITEIFPNPAGVDDGEFFEFYNPTKVPISATGCIVWLNDKRKTVLKDFTVPSKKYLIVEKTVSKLSLTNTGGAVKLVDTDGAELLALAYPKAPDNESWSLVGREWTWTNRVTPAGPNLAPTDDEEATPVKEQKEEILQSIGLTDVQTMETGTLVRIRGVVTVAPDVLGARTIFLQSASGAVSAVLPDGAPKVLMGDELELMGKVRLSQGRKRVTVEKDGVQKIGSGTPIEPTVITLDQLSPELADMFVRVTGVVSTATGAKFLIDDGTAEAEVYLKSSTGMVKPRSASGDRLVADGIVSVTTSGIRVWPRMADDLRVERVLGATTSAPTVQKLTTAPTHQNIWYWGLVGLGLLAAGAKPLLDFLRKKNPAAVEGLKPRK